MNIETFWYWTEELNCFFKKLHLTTNIIWKIIQSFVLKQKANSNKDNYIIFFSIYFTNTLELLIYWVSLVSQSEEGKSDLWLLNSWTTFSLAHLIFHYFTRTAIASVVGIKGQLSKNNIVTEGKHLEGRKAQIPLGRNWIKSLTLARTCFNY